MNVLSYAVKTVAVLSSVFLASGSLVAQSAQKVDLHFWEKTFGQMALIGGCIVLTAAFVTIVRLFDMLVKMQEIQMLREKGLEQVAEHYAQPGKSMFVRLWERMQGTVPIAQEKEILFEHEYDGIRELDNSLPPWWLWMFYISIVIAGIYLYVYHISGSGLSSKEQYEVQMATAQKEIDDYLSRQADAVNEKNVVTLTDSKALTEGAEIFKSLCAVCHGSSGEGGVGPNMTDAYWIHGGDIKDLYKTILYGVPEKGMISWSSQLRPSDIQKVSSYILTLQGTTPPNPKAPQGDLWVVEKTAVSKDTVIQ